MSVVFSAKCARCSALKNLSMVAFTEKDNEPIVEEITPEPKSNQPVDLVELRRDVRKLMAWSQIIHQQNKAIKRRLTWMTINGYIKLVLWLAPLIWLGINIPRWLQEAQSTLDSVKSGQFITSSTIWSKFK